MIHLYVILQSVIFQAVILLYVILLSVISQKPFLVPFC
jgi:hypothetical protein